MPRTTHTENARLEIKLAMERAKLAALKKDLPAHLLKPAAPFVRLKDLRPPTPEERALLCAPAPKGGNAICRAGPRKT